MNVCVRMHVYVCTDAQMFVPLVCMYVCMYVYVRMYVCGPTVYDHAHLGNAKTPIVFDVLYRLLRHVYGAEHVKYASNITDIDDKILTKAKETGKSAAMASSWSSSTVR